MLQQILEQMYIEPELLEELSEDQKQMLFYKMRQEQVRKWKLHEEKMDAEDKKGTKNPPRPGKKKVDFLKGRDGCDWVWVMGDHKNDKAIEKILEEETLREAEEMAEAEAQAQREKEETELNLKMEEEKQRIIRENEEREVQRRKEEEEAERNKSLKEAQLMKEKMEAERKRLEEEEKKRLAEIERAQALLKEHTVDWESPILNSPFLSAEEKVLRRRSREMSDSMKEKRSSEIFSTLQRKRLEMEKLAEESQAEVETNWKEQEQKAKEAELQLRESARKARVEYNESLRRSLTKLHAAQAFTDPNNKGVKPPLPPKKHLMVTSAPGLTNKKPRPLRPKNREMIVSWFHKEELPRKCGIDPETGKVGEWFHGIINRKDSEEILKGKESGAFLVRVSERVWGYTLSYKENSIKNKHFLIDASDLGYQFFGADQTMHSSLVELVKYHKENPITVSGLEKLLIPCGQICDPPDHADLFKSSEVTSL